MARSEWPHAAGTITAAWGRLSSAVLERRVASALRRHLRELYREQSLRVALRHTRGPGLRVPRIALHGDFARLPEGRLLGKAFFQAVSNSADLPEEVRRIEGMSGQRYRALINYLVRQLPDARYLEVGSWLGSTAAAAMHGNTLDAVCIDNWSEFGGPKALFLKNMERVRSPSANFRMIESDFRQVDYGALGPFNIYLFDGPHAEQDQYDGIMLVRPALDRRAIIIVDDWNWQSVRIGTFRALRDASYRVEASIEITTSRGNSTPSVLGKDSDWHNGYFLCVCTAP